MNDIKSRIKSVSGTMQITKAMELVATSKLRKARERIENSRPFHQLIKSAIDSIEASSEVKESIWSRKSECKKPLILVIAGDRGLAGGYNANIFRLTATLAEGKEVKYLPIGKKALDYYNHRSLPMLSQNFGYVSEVSVSASLDMAEMICRGFVAGEFDGR